MRKGFFITFEGNDGSGKTTQIRLLSEYLKEKGIEVVLTREPGGTPIGEQIRSILLDKANKDMHPVTEMILYAASRAQLVNTLIRPAIEEGKAVICDRFVDSSYAYQAMGRGLGLKAVRTVNSYAIGDCMPDITFFMDIDADTAMQRRNASGEEADRMESEKMEFHRSVYEGYKNLISLYPERIKPIDVQKSPEQVFESIKAYVDQLLNKLEG
ncbi:MAG: dTMP kinase [Clostridiaceae bacterium]|nr:dTMP kinase [Clostridiaceae bacterium]